MKKYILTISIGINLVFAVLMIRHLAVSHRINKIKKITYWLHRDEVLNHLQIDSNSIVFAGDSHTQQFELAELFGSLNVKNRGINFDTSTGLLKRVSELTKGARKVFIEIGSNDVTQKIPKGTTVSNINRIVEKIRTESPKTIIYVESIIPMKNHQMLIDTLNKAIRNLCDAHKLSFINLDPLFLKDGLNPKYDSGDGVHLNSKGYFAWKGILTPYIFIRE